MTFTATSEASQTYEPGSVVFGLTYWQWTVQWWRGFLSKTKSINPVHDEPGSLCSEHQPSVPVWFLGGKVGSTEKKIPKRECTIPAYKSILFPVITCEVNSLECPDLNTTNKLVEHVRADENGIVYKECTLDGTSLDIKRVESDPVTFELEICKDNAFGLDIYGKTIAAADGYWVFLKPLTKGEHYITFRGSCEKGRLNCGAEYDIYSE